MINQTLQRDDIAIEHLRIRGPANTGNKIARDLVNAAPPQARGESWVFVRKLKISGSSSNAAEKILQQIQHSLTLAEQGHCDENLVRFNDLTALLAALLIDLSSGRASGRWYWQRWVHLFSLPKPAATASLMAQHWDSLNAVSAQLARQGALLDVWQSLDPINAEHLIGELARHNGIALSNQHFQAESASQDQAAGSLIADRLIDRWQPIFDYFEANDSRRQLAILLIGQEALPLLLTQVPERAITLISGCFTTPQAASSVIGKDRSAGTVSNTGQSSSESSQNKIASIRTGGKPSASSASAQSYSDNLHQAYSPDEDLDAQNTRSISDTGKSEAFDRTPAALSKKPQAWQTTERDADKNPQGPSPPFHPESTAATHSPFKRLSVRSHQSTQELHRFHTGEGGVFYLLNFLDRAEAQTLMGEFWQQLPNGWGWLYRLAQTLHFNEDDPLSEFFAHQLGFDSTQQLNELPPLPVEDELTKLASRWYGKTGIWRPALLHLQAQIAFSPSHVDLTTSLNNVRLEIRLSGLDINPGWLPWLGRVVQFHYETDSS